MYSPGRRNSPPVTAGLPRIMWTTICLLVAIASPACGHPGGSPSKACGDLYPWHGGHQPQTSPAPYSITLSPTTYSPGDTITVTIGGDEFEGFQLAARRTTGNVQPVGTFTNYPNTVRGQSWYPQITGAVNCLTHLDESDKSNLEVIWTAPSSSVGDVVFSATVLEDFDVFWVGVQQTLTASVASAEAGYTGQASVVSFSSVDEATFRDQCGVTEGCVLSGDNYAAVFSSQGSSVDVKLIAKATDYVMLGLSDDKTMGDDLTVTCTLRDGSGEIQLGFNPDYHNYRHLDTNLSNVEVSSSGGMLFCAFSLPNIVTISHIIEPEYEEGDTPTVTTQDYTFDLAQKYYVFIGVGTLYDGTHVPEKHKLLPVVSNSKVDLHSAVTVSAQQLSTLVRVHASLALLAWFLFTIIGMCIARHFRDLLSQKFLKSVVWMRLHLFLMSSVGVLTLISVIIIFVDKGGWTRSATPHAVLGLITTSLCMIQVVWGLLRPDPNTKHRPMFSWAHRLGSVFIYIFAVITMILGCVMEYYDSQLKAQLVAVFTSGLAIFILYEIVLEIVRYNMAASEPNEEKCCVIKSSCKGVRFFWLVLLTAIAVVLYLLFVVFLASY